MIGVWKIDESGSPVRQPSGVLASEFELQDWIAKDPSVLEDGLKIIGREVEIDRARRIDLIGIDLEQQLVVIELKAGQLARAVVAQTLDYLAHLTAMPADELERVLTAAIEKRRNGGAEVASFDELGLSQAIESRLIRGIAAGIDERPDVATIASYLAEHTVPIRHVRFSLATDGAARFLVREVDDPAASSSSSGVSRRPVDEVVASTRLRELEPSLRALTEVAAACGLASVGFRWSVMISPPARRGHMLLTLSDDYGRALTLYYSPDRFAEHFDTTAERVREVIGEPTGDRCPLTADLCDRLAAALPELTQRHMRSDR